MNSANAYYYCPPVQAEAMSMPNSNINSSSSYNDTEEIASFLLSLKHRSVTPEPSVAGDHSVSPSSTSTHHSASASTSASPFSYPSPKRRSDEQLMLLQQQQPFVDKTPALMMAELKQQQQQLSMSMEDIPVEELMGDTKLVLKKDRDLVPDSLFVAMSQMRPCELTQADRVGCYKNRELGFVGMSCIHCGGQPGFGRYYPNSVRSLAQTTTSQTILKHVGSKCRFAPPHIRNAVNELQRQQVAREGMSSGRPRYGSRKIFFQRVWARLHGGPLPEEDEVDASSVPKASLNDDASNQTPDVQSESTSRDSSPVTSDDEDFAPSQQSTLISKRKTGFLPTQKNKRPRTLSN